MKPSPVERFWLRITKQPNGCHEWTKATDGSGYGVTRFNKKSVTTHRLAWILTNGPIPAGMCVCHTCDNRICCNPDHLWLGTTQENTADKMAKGRHSHPHNELKTHCKHGHAFDEANTWVSKEGKRSCRACHRASEAVRFANNPESFHKRSRAARARRKAVA